MNNVSNIQKHLKSVFIYTYNIELILNALTTR